MPAFPPFSVLIPALLPFASPAAQRPVGTGHAQPAERLTEAPFRVLDNVEGDDIDLLNYPIKPMAVSPNHLTLWAVNTHNSEVLSFTNLSGTPNKVFPVP